MEEKPKRGSWGNWSEFLFSALGSLVGLGNIWRFPFVCYRSGGGAFLIPFFVAMVVCGCPTLLVETQICQFSSLGPGKVWVVSPLFRGIGYGMITLTGIVSIYYTMIMGWTLYYLAMAFQSDLPWASCNNTWNTDQCVIRHLPNDSSRVPHSDPSGSSEGGQSNGTTMTSEQEFWFRGVLDKTDSIEELGTVRWQLLLCLVVAWIVVLLCLCKGIKSLGKVVYVAATLPYLVLTALLVRGCLLPGASDGIYFYIVPQFGKLLDLNVWKNAATQVFFSIGLGFGVISTLASYNKFNNNVLRDAYLLPVLDCLTSVFAGFVIFTYLGYMAHMAGKPISEVADEGPGLVFIAYPAALSTLPLPQLWAVLFFLMLFTVGLDSQIMHVQTVTAALADCYPDQLMGQRTKLMLVTCGLSCLAGVILTTQGGSFVLNLMDWYVGSISVMVLVWIELVVLAWVYGTERLYQDLEAMIGYRPSAAWMLAWKYATPIFIMVLWLYGVVKYRTIGSAYPGYPVWADVLGLCIAFLPLVPGPVLLVLTLSQYSGGWRQRLRQSMQPTQQWRAHGGQARSEELVDMCVKV